MVHTDMLQPAIDHATLPEYKKRFETALSPEFRAPSVIKVISALLKGISGKFFDYEVKELVY